jgi:hypothetical protein
MAGSDERDLRRLIHMTHFDEVDLRGLIHMSRLDEIDLGRLIYADWPIKIDFWRLQTARNSASVGHVARRDSYARGDWRSRTTDPSSKTEKAKTTEASELRASSPADVELPQATTKGKKKNGHARFFMS